MAGHPPRLKRSIDPARLSNGCLVTMEGILVSAVTGALDAVLGKLADRYKRLKRVPDDIKFLTDELTAMRTFLQKMSDVEDPDVQEKEWTAVVRELSYDMEDSIDDFIQYANDKDTKPGIIEKAKNFWEKIKTQHQTALDIEDLKKRISEVGQRNQTYKTPRAFSNPNNTTVDTRALAVCKNASELVGMDEPKAQLMKLLTEGGLCVSRQQQLNTRKRKRKQQQQQQPPKMVAIVGSGGMGKTTLAKQVYEDLKGQFECHVFLSVS